jgi:diguanylate cyclase (GGDEF)-like protein
VTNVAHELPALASLEEELLQTRSRLADHEALLRKAMTEKGELLLRELEATRVRAYEASEAAQKDPVTQLLRHGTFRSRLSFELQRSRRTASPLGLLLADLDNFSSYNSAHGYVEGEKILAVVGRSLPALWLGRPGPRPPVFGREGGDCLGVLLPGADRREVLERAERVRDLIERIPSGKTRITASIGASLLASEDTVDGFLARAYAALSRAQESGGNATAFEGSND